MVSYYGKEDDNFRGNRFDWQKVIAALIDRGDDVIGIFLHALDNSNVKGELNGAAHQPVTMKEFRKVFRKVMPKRTIDSGYEFQDAYLKMHYKQL